MCDREIKRQRDRSREIGRDREVEHERRARGLKKMQKHPSLGACEVTNSWGGNLTNSSRSF